MTNYTIDFIKMSEGSFFLLLKIGRYLYSN